MKKQFILFSLSILLFIGCTNQNISSNNNLPNQQPVSTLFDDSEDDSNAIEYSIFLIALEDKGLNGKEIGCGDSVVSVIQTSPEKSPTDSELMSEAFTTLLNFKNPDHTQSAYNNFLDKSTLKLVSAEIINGVAKVELSGQISSGGVCDDPRIIAQLEETAAQFPEVQSVEIFINNKPLRQIFNLKG